VVLLANHRDVHTADAAMLSSLMAVSAGEAATQIREGDAPRSRPQVSQTKLEFIETPRSGLGVVYTGTKAVL
jgi:hypothetical protein